MSASQTQSVFFFVLVSGIFLYGIYFLDCMSDMLLCTLSGSLPRSSSFLLHDYMVPSGLEIFLQTVVCAPVSQRKSAGV